MNKLILMLQEAFLKGKKKKSIKLCTNAQNFTFLFLKSKTKYHTKDIIKIQNISIL